MMNYCDVCQQSYPEECPSCPHCAGKAAGESRAALNGFHKDSHGIPAHREAAHVSDPEIDLGSPVVSPSAPGPSGPPSGASFTSWAELAPAKPGEGEAPRPRLVPQGRGGPETPPEVTIDLDQTPRSPEDPPSGASFASWAEALPPRKEKPPVEPPVVFGAPPPGVKLPDLDEDEPGSVRSSTARTARGLMETAESPAAENPTLSAPAVFKGGWGPGLLIGVILGVAVSVALWSAGIEPPQGFRRQVYHWLGKTVPPTPAPLTGAPE